VTFTRRRLTVAEAVRAVGLDPPLGNWWFLVTASDDAVLPVASAVAVSAAQYQELRFSRMLGPRDEREFLRRLVGTPNDALIFAALPGPSPVFWQKLDKVRPRLCRAAPTIVVLTESTEHEVRTRASHLGAWLSGQSLYVHDPDAIGRATRERLYDALLLLLPSQFEEVVLLLSLPVHHLPGLNAPQAERSIALLHLLQQQDRLAELSPRLRAMGVFRW
jgi:hypothetical protein